MPDGLTKSFLSAKVATMSEEDKSARWIEQHPTTDGVGVIWSADGGDLRLSASQSPPSCKEALSCTPSGG